jgi:tyrosinase
MVSVRPMLLVFLCLLIYNEAVEAQTFSSPLKTCGPRIRKAWEQFSSQEQEIYLRAVSLGMEKGYFSQFARIHANEISSDQAQRTCGFLLWHRRFLLAYENMLRSFGPEFQCITIPVWNFFGAFALQQQNKCKTMEECSPLMQALGGSQGMDKLFTIDNRKFWGNCVETGPAGKYCDYADVGKNACAKCIPRGKWNEDPFPASLSYSQLIEKMGAANGYRTLNNGLLMYSKSAIHTALKGISQSFYAPMDPLFFSLQATYDMLHHIYFLCRLGGFLSDEEKQTLPEAWETCGLNNHFDPPTATSEVNMIFFNGQKDVSADFNTELAPFFKDLPKNFYEYVDLSDLGKHTYSYQLTTTIADLLLNPNNAFKCPAITGRRLHTQLITEELKDTSQVRAEQKSLDWYYSAFELAKESVENDEQKAQEEVEIMDCQLYNATTIGTIKDFPLEIRQEREIPENIHPRCYELFEIKKKTHSSVPEWKTLAKTKLNVVLL